jgi:hypothetical protein
MKNKFITFSLLAAFFVSGVGAKEIAPDHEALRYVGRFTEDYRFGWTGCSIDTVFQGTELIADLEVTKGTVAGLTVVVDGESRFVKLEAGRQSVKVFLGGESQTEHRITLFKRSEGALGEIKFHGFDASEDAVVSRPSDRELKMLVIGDSITCGYGNEAQHLSEGNTVENENGYKSYAPIAARALDADLMMFCWSGRGMFRNRQLNYDQATTIPKIFNQTLPQSRLPAWDHARYVPDVIVINLGTNDMSENNGQKPPLSKDGYIDAYKQFLTRLRGYWPDSKIVLSIGPMGNASVSHWLPEIAAEFTNTFVLIYSPFSGREDKAGNYHPSVKKDRSMAAELVAAVQEIR